MLTKETNSSTIHKTYEQFSSERAEEIISKQPPMDKAVIARVKDALAKQYVALEQNDDLDRYLMSTGKEAITYSDGSILLHSNVSASGFFEELIHLGQVRSGRTVYGDPLNHALMEIEAQEKLIRNQKAYNISDYEISIIRDNLAKYQADLEKLMEGE